MTSHTNCLHPKTKAARAACRKAAAAYEAFLAEAAPLDPRDDKDLDHAEKTSLAVNPFHRAYPEEVLGSNWWDHYSEAEGYLENASLADSASWVKDMTANELTEAARSYAEDNLGPVPTYKARR